LARLLLLSAIGAILFAASDYVIESNKCLEPYAYEWKQWPASYEFWCINYQVPLLIAIFIGVLLFAGGLLGAIALWVKSKLRRRSN